MTTVKGRLSKESKMDVVSGVLTRNNAVGFDDTSGSSHISVYHSRSRHRSSSPFSPHHITRVQEKEDLQNLNDRLAVYIDKVRRLEDDNSRLQGLISSYSDTQEREVRQIKSMYDSELSEARRTLDQLAKDRAKLEIDVGKYRSDAEDALARLAKKEREFRQVENRLKQLENEISEMKSKYDAVMYDLNRKSDELIGLKSSVSDLEKQLGRTRKQLEDETLLRVDLENQNLSLREELQFKSQVHQQEIEQLRSQKRIEVQEADERIKEEYDNRLLSELNRIRDDTENKINEMREEVEACFQKKLQDAEDAAKRNNTNVSALKEDITTARRRLSEVMNDRDALQRKCAAYEDKIKELENRYQEQQQRYDDTMQDRELQINRLTEEFSSLSNDYQVLLDVKVSLDQEIAAYRKLLESEEERLNLSQVSSRSLQGSSLISNSSGGGRGKKRRIEEVVEEFSKTAFSSSSTCKGPIEIIEEDNENGSFVKIYNNSENDVAVSGWTLKRTADSDKFTEYKFGRLVVIQAGASSTIWSSNAASAVHEPPKHFKMKDKNWPVGDKVLSILQDSEEHEIAIRESARVFDRSSMSRSSVSRNSTPRPISGSVTSKFFGGVFRSKN